MIGTKVFLTGLILSIVIMLFGDEIKSAFKLDGLATDILALFVLCSFAAIPVGLLIMIWES